MAETDKVHVLFVGNPGRGKSTLLNCFAGKLLFKAGVSFGSGLTTVLQTEECDNIVYMDTPGLSDVELRKQAAAAISDALKKDGDYKVFFVVTIESGRVRLEDQATMRVVLEAAPEIGGQYGVIVNKVSKPVLDRMTPKEKGEIRAGLFCDLIPSEHVYYNILDMELFDLDDKVKPLPQTLRDFINGLRPIRITAEKVSDVNVSEYDEVVQKLESRLDALLKDNEELRKELERQRNQTPMSEMVDDVRKIVEDPMVQRFVDTALPFAQDAFVNLFSSAIVARQVYPKDFSQMGTDAGSGAAMDLKYYEAEGLQDDELLLGHSPGGRAMMVVKKGKYVQPAMGWTRIWNDKGSLSWNDYDIFIPTHEKPEFKALGVFCNFRNSGHAAPQDLLGRVAMVHESQLEEAKLGEVDWEYALTWTSSAKYAITLNRVAGVGTMWPSKSTLLNPGKAWKIKDSSWSEA